MKIENLKNLIWEPSKLFKNIIDKPSWLLPFIIITITGISVTVLLYPAQIKLIFANLPATVAEEDIRFALSQTSKVRYIGYSFIPLITIIKIGITSGIILLGSYLFSDNIKYIQSFALVCWSSIILQLGDLLNIIIIYLRGIDSINDQSDLALIGINSLFGINSTGLVVSTLLNEISVFSIWYISLISIALMIIGKLSKIQAIFTSIFVWSIITGYKVGVAVIGTQFAT